MKDLPQPSIVQGNGRYSAYKGNKLFKGRLHGFFDVLGEGLLLRSFFGTCDKSTYTSC
jgi:hypothetical protein